MGEGDRFWKKSISTAYPPALTGKPKHTDTQSEGRKGGRGRDREREKHRERERNLERERETYIHRETHTHRETHRKKHTEKETKKRQRQRYLFHIKIANTYGLYEVFEAFKCNIK